MCTLNLHCPVLPGVARGGGGVAPARGCGPGEGSRTDLFEPPSPGLLNFMVMAAQRGQIAEAGPAAVVVGERMVGITLRSGTSAAGKNAGDMPDLDPMAKGSRGPVGRGLPCVITVTAGQRAEGEGPGSRRWVGLRSAAGPGLRSSGQGGPRFARGIGVSGSSGVSGRSDLGIGVRASDWPGSGPGAAARR